jgi:hypothetical protein
VSKLYIANTSKQHQEFMYRLPEATPKKAIIPIGGQVCIGNFGPNELATIIAHNAQYGLLSAKEFSRRRGHVGLVYSIDEPIKLDRIFESFEANGKALDEAAEERRERVAEVVATDIKQTLSNVGASTRRAEVEIVEMGSVQTPDAQGTPRVSTGYEAVEEGVTPRHAGRKGRRARAAN